MRGKENPSFLLFFFLFLFVSSFSFFLPPFSATQSPHSIPIYSGSEILNFKAMGQVLHKNQLPTEGDLILKIEEQGRTKNYS